MKLMTIFTIRQLQKDDRRQISAILVRVHPQIERGQCEQPH